MTIEDLKKAYRVRPGYWFAPKLFGFGATPVTWQGWALIVGFLAAVFGLIRLIPQDGARVAAILAVTVPFVVLVWMKTDGVWKWHWGWRR